MRTAIFFGFLCLSDATRKDWIGNENEAAALVVCGSLLIIMDVAEWFKKMFK